MSKPQFCGCGWMFPGIEVELDVRAPIGTEAQVTGALLKVTCPKCGEQYGVDCAPNKIGKLEPKNKPGVSS